MSRLNSWSIHEKILFGIDNILFYLKDFYGPNQNVGSGVAYTQDGYSFLDKIQFTDPEENLGASFSKELAQQIIDLHGDGVITGILLLHALLKGCLELLMQGSSLNQLIKSLKQTAQKLLLSIEQLSWPLRDPVKAHALVFTATQNASVAQEIAQVFECIGYNGAIALRIDDYLVQPYITQGIRIEDRNLFSHCIKTQEIDTIVSPKILVTDQYIHTLFHLLPCLQQIVINKEPLVIFCRDISPDALATLTINKLHYLIDITVIRLHTTAETHSSIFEDLSLITGAKNFSTSTYSDQDRIPKYEELGSCASVELSKLGTIIVQGAGAPEVLALKIRQLEENICRTTCEKEKQLYIKRIQRLQSFVAILSVPQELYTTYLLALTNLYEAIEHGYVIGGGATLFYAINRLSNDDYSQNQEVYHMLKKACLAPLTQLLHNINVDAHVAIHKLHSLGNPIFGVNTTSRQMEDFLVSGILEPTSKIKDIFMKAVLMTIQILTLPHIAKNQ